METLETVLYILSENKNKNKIEKKNITQITCESIFTKWIECINRTDNNVKKNYLCNNELIEYLECIDKNSNK